MATACRGNPASSPLSQQASLRVCAAPRRRTALTWMHDEHMVRVPMSPREPAPRTGPENQLDSPVLVAWSVTCDSPPPAVLEPSSPVAPASEPLVYSPWILGIRHARHTLAPRRTLALCEIDTAVCQGSPSSPLSSPRSSASKANEPESPWRAAWTLTCETPPTRPCEIPLRAVPAIDINSRKHSLVECISTSAATMAGLEAADTWATRMQHGDTMGDTSGPASFSTAHSPSSRRWSPRRARSPEHEHGAEAVAPSKRRRRADRVPGAERMAQRAEPASVTPAWAERHHPCHQPLGPPSALWSRRAGLDGDLALVTPSLSVGVDVMSTPPEKSLSSLDVASTPTFAAAMSDDVDATPCDEVRAPHP